MSGANPHQYTHGQGESSRGTGTTYRQEPFAGQPDKAALAAHIGNEATILLSEEVETLRRNNRLLRAALEASRNLITDCLNAIDR